MTAPATLDERVEGASLPSPGPAWPQPRPRLVTWTLNHRLFASALAAALVLRVIVAVAYPPALEFTGDSPSYLTASRAPFELGVWHPFGYPVFLWVMSATHSLALVTLLQHAMGLAAAVLVYRLVRSFDVGPIGATVAAAPLLFDAYQLDVEQFILSDTLFTLLIVLALTLSVRLLRHGGFGTAVAIGALLAAAALTRTVGLALAATVVVVLLIGRAGWARTAAVAAACALPIGCYAIAFHATYGVYGLQGYGGRYLYGLVGQFADCNRASMPVDVRGLCPTEPKYARPGVNQYVWNDYNLAHVPGDSIRRSTLAGNFARPIVTRQLGDVVSVTTGNVLHYFAPGREAGPRDWFAGSWQFPLRDTSPAWNIYPAKFGFREDDFVKGDIVDGLAHMLRGYQHVVFVPGTALALALLAAAIACCRRRVERTTRTTIALAAVAGLSLLVLPSLSAGFDWRYLLPAQALLAPAGVLAMHTLLPQLRATLRRALPVTGVLVAVAVVAPGLASAGVAPAAELHASVRSATPATLPIGTHASVRLETPVLVGTRCTRTNGGRYHLLGLIAIPTTVTYRSGPSMLVEPDDIGISNGELTTPWIPPHGAILPSLLISQRYPRVRGTVYANVASAAGTLRYVDPLGGGAAAWTYRLASPPHRPALGDPCTGSIPWAGRQLPYLRVTKMPAFTQLTEQQVSYGLHWQSWRADSYDLRFRVASPTAAPAPWQYPRSWQRTTLTEQTLVSLSPGITYCFSVRARDDLDAVTDWSLPKCTARMYDDASLPSSPNWVRGSDQPGFYGGTYTATRTKNATIGLSGTFSRIAISAYRGPGCGILDVYVGKRLLHSINLSAPAAQASLFQWVSSPLPDQTAAVTLRVRTPNQLVAIDAFGLLR